VVDAIVESAVREGRTNTLLELPESSPVLEVVRSLLVEDPAGDASAESSLDEDADSDVESTSVSPDWEDSAGCALSV